MLSNEEISNISKQIKSENTGYIANRPTEKDSLTEYDSHVLKSVPDMESLMYDDEYVEHSIQFTFSECIMGTLEDSVKLYDKFKICKNIINTINTNISKHIDSKEVSQLVGSIFALRKNNDYVIILQCVFKMHCNDKLKVIETCHQFSYLFSYAGMVIIREKISVDTNKTEGTPIKSRDISKLNSNKYFETVATIENTNVDDMIKVTKEYTIFFETNITHYISFTMDDNKAINNKSVNIIYIIKGDCEKNKENKLSQLQTKLSLDGHKISSFFKGYVWYDTYEKMNDELIDFQTKNIELAKNRYNKINEFINTYYLHLLIGSGLLTGLMIGLRRK